MKQRVSPLGELEQQVMDVIWREDCATVRCVYENLQKQRDIAYTTVMTTMDRLAKKKLLKRVKVGKAYEYKPVQTEQQLQSTVSQSIIDSLIQNYGDLALAQFVDVVGQIDQKKLNKLKKQLTSNKAA